MLKYLFVLLLPLFALGEDEGDFTEELTKQRADRAKTIEAIPTNDVLKMAEDLESIGKDPMKAASIMDEKVQKSMSELYANGIMEKIPPEQMRATFLERFKGTKIEGILRRFPVILDIMVDVVRDREAMPGLLRLMGRKKDLKFYFQVWLVIFVLSFFIKRYWLKPRMEELGFVVRTFIGLIFSMSITVLTVFIFYVIFKPDIKPFFLIVAKHLTA